MNLRLRLAYMLLAKRQRDQLDLQQRQLELIRAQGPALLDLVNGHLGGSAGRT